MSPNEPHTIGPTLEALLEQVLFSDPATHPIREAWERTKAEEQANFERVCQEQYETQLEYHQICRTPDAEQEARREAALLRPMLREELDDRLAERWAVVLRRIQAVLADNDTGSEETPATGSTSREEDISGT